MDMKNFRIIAALLAAQGLLVSPTLFALEDPHPLEDIYNTAQVFAYQQVNVLPDEELEIVVGSVDSRLQFKKCESSLQGFLPQGINSTTLRLVGVKCANPTWSLFVPIRASLYSSVLVASKLLPKDQLITEEDIQLSRQDKMTLHHGYYKNKADIIGKAAKRQIQTGALFTQDSIQTNKVIKRGDLITIIAKTGNLIVKSQGLAMEEGEIGATIKIKNEQSKRVVEGVVASAGVVTVPL
jgi:flagella basal body P-ring formation protein FlgA